MEFSFEFYEKILVNLHDLGFEWGSFNNYFVEKSVYLRHDVDIFCENAVNMAKIEKDVGAFAIYFFQPNCEFYNMLSPSVMKLIETLSSLGHYIGLHIDANSFKERKELEDYIRTSYEFYKKYLPITNIISFHRPPTFVLENFEVKEFINVYGEKYFKKIRYFSDSGRREFYDQLLESLKSDAKTSIQLLTHPYWWDHISLDIWEDYERFIKVKNIKIQNELKNGFKPYAKLFDERFVI